MKLGPQRGQGLAQLRIVPAGDQKLKAWDSSAWVSERGVTCPSVRDRTASVRRGRALPQGCWLYNAQY